MADVNGHESIEELLKQEVDEITIKVSNLTNSLCKCSANSWFSLGELNTAITAAGQPNPDWGWINSRVTPLIDVLIKDMVRFCLLQEDYSKNIEALKSHGDKQDAEMYSREAMSLKHSIMSRIVPCQMEVKNA